MGWWKHFGGHGHHGGRHDHFRAHFAAHCGGGGRRGWGGFDEDAGAPALGDKLMLALVLEALEKAPGSGYDVVQALEARLGGTWGFGPQQVYPVLRLAEDAGFVQGQAADGKTTYTVSEAGHVELAARRELLAGFQQRVEALRAKAEIGQLFREVRELAWAFREALGGDRLDKARIAALKDLLARARDVLGPDEPQAQAS